MLDLEFKCNFCEKIYKIKNSLLSHKNKKHKQERLQERLEEKIQKKDNNLKQKKQKIKQEEIKQEEIKQEEIKQEENKQEEIKQEEIKQEENKQEESILIYDFNSENDREKLLFKLDDKTKLKFLKENHNDQIIKLFELIYNNNIYNEFKNIILKKNNNLYFYKNKNYILCDNNEKLLNQVVENYHWNINEIYCEFLTNKKDSFKIKSTIDFIDDQQSIREGLFYSKNIYVNDNIEYKSFIEYNKIKIFDFLQKKYLL